MDFSLNYGDTHMNVYADYAVESDAYEFLIEQYGFLLKHINANPFFKTSFSPVNSVDDAPEIIVKMIEASSAADVGPMAAVAGTIAQLMGEFLLNDGATEVICDNGGDIFAYVKNETIVGVYSGGDGMDGFGFKIYEGDCPICICTSSDTVGHSISLGKADAVTVFSKEGAVADAFATKYANMIKCEKDIENVLGISRGYKGISGVYIRGFGKVGLSGKLPPLIHI